MSGFDVGPYVELLRETNEALERARSERLAREGAEAATTTSRPRPDPVPESEREVISEPSSAELRDALPTLGVRSFAGHHGRPVTFLRPGVPNRNVTCVAGDGGVGKSLLTLGWVADVVAAGGDALVVVAEDGPDVAQLRLRALEAELAHVHFLTLEWGLDEQGQPDYDAAAISLPEQGDELDAIVQALGPKLRLVVIDPWAECLDDSVDSHVAKSLRRAIATLRRIASRRDVAIVVVAHLNKSAALSLRKRIDGSGALYDGARSVFLLANDPEDEDVRVLAHGKSNITELLDAREYELEAILVPADKGEPEGKTARLADADERSERTVEQLLGERGNGPASTVTEAAQEWLRAALADRGWHDSDGLKTLAVAAGIRRRTLERAAQGLGVEHERRGFPASTWWRRPAAPTPSTDAPAGADLAQQANPHQHADSADFLTSRANVPKGGSGVGATGVTDAADGGREEHE